MRPAEFTARLEYLGLGRAWVASAGGVSERTVDYWCTGAIHPRRGKMTVPRHIAALLINLDKQLWDAAKRTVELTLEQADEHVIPGEIELFSYRTEKALWSALPEMGEAKLPVATHQVLLSRTQSLLNQAGFKAQIYSAPDGK